MCTLGKIAACEVSFLPIQSGLEYNVGAMSTLVRGEKDKLFKLLEEIYAKMDEECKFVITAKISNICGCEL